MFLRAIDFGVARIGKAVAPEGEGPRDIRPALLKRGA